MWTESEKVQPAVLSYSLSHSLTYLPPAFTKHSIHTHSTHVYTLSHAVFFTCPGQPGTAVSPPPPPPRELTRGEHEVCLRSKFGQAKADDEQDFFLLHKIFGVFKLVDLGMEQKRCSYNTTTTTDETRKVRFVRSVCF